MSTEDKRMQITAERLLGIAELAYVGVQVVDGASANALIRALLRVVEAYDKTTATSIQRDRLIDIHAFIQQALTDDETRRRIVEVCELTRTYSLDQIEGILAVDTRLKAREVIQEPTPVVPANDSVESVDKRMRVVLGLMSADAVFIVRCGRMPVTNNGTECSLCGGWGFIDDTPGQAPRECSCDLDADSGVEPLLWRPNSAGYVSEYNPWQAGLYTEPTDYKPCGVEPDAHSYVVPVSEYMGGVRVQDGTPVAVLVDEIVRLRSLIDNELGEERVSLTLRKVAQP